MLAPLSRPERLVRDRLAEGRDAGATVQVNLTFSPKERELLDRLAADLGWSMRKVVATGLQTLEATLQELAADAVVSADG